MKKKILVPYVAELENASLAQVGAIMETQAQRDYIDTVNWDSYSYKPIAAFDIARSHTDLYIRYFSKGNSLKALFLEDGSPVYQDSAVEFFMKKEGEDHYTNFEFNCIGCRYGAVMKDRNTMLHKFTADDYAGVQTKSSLPKETFAEKEGNFAWELLVVISFKTLKIDPENLPEKIYGNFYKCADNTKFPHYLSWNPIDLVVPNFHCPEFFGEIIFK